MGVLFVDCETTGLDPAEHEPWEVAIVQPSGREDVWCWRPSDDVMRNAEPKALEVGHFRDRAPLVADYDYQVEAARTIAELVDGQVIVGSNPHFDVQMLSAWLAWHGHLWSAHYRPVCAVTMAAGYLHNRGWVHRVGQDPVDANDDFDDVLAAPWRSYDISRAVGIAPPAADERHTALGDARWVARLYARLIAG